MNVRRRDNVLIGLIGGAVIAVVVVVGLVAWAAGHQGAKTTTITVEATGARSTGPSAATVSPQIATGAHVFVQFACGECHGMNGGGGVSAAVPALTQVGRQLTIAQLTHIINHGLGESANPTQPFMPVWGEVISHRQVAALVAYIRAGLPTVEGATPLEVPREQGLEVAGSVLYVRDGCINCHGPNGLGGVPNPQAPDKTIPSLSGVDFRHEFNTDAKITEFIRSGSVIGRAPIVSMPHWGGIISNQDLQALVAYLKTLKP